jgi:hypothetical protein
LFSFYYSVLNDEQVGNAPIVILGTKNDIRPIGEEDFREELRIHGATTEVKEHIYLHSNKCFS